VKKEHARNVIIIQSLTLLIFRQKQKKCDALSHACSSFCNYYFVAEFGRHRCSFSEGQMRSLIQQQLGIQPEPETEIEKLTT
jgi:hypothetical protein